MWMKKKKKGGFSAAAVVLEKPAMVGCLRK